jgi:hypothetical protein
MREIEQKLRDFFQSIEIYPPFTSDPIRIRDFNWNKSMEDFKVTYLLGNAKHVFHYNEQIAREIDVDFSKNPLEQLEKEVLYIKRANERGIGAKEYFPFTEIE